MSEQLTQRWFRQSARNDEPASKWHASRTARLSPHGYCGFDVPILGIYETVVLPIGELPIHEPGEDAVCLHCQRALEMARRDE